MTAAEIYKIASSNKGRIVKVYCDVDVYTGSFNTDQRELGFSAISNLWDFTEKDRSIKLRTHWIDKIDTELK